MAVRPPSRVPIVAYLVASSVFGYYATFSTSSKNGLFASIAKAVGSGPDTTFFAGGPSPYLTTYTGVAVIDDQLRLLIAFFDLILTGPQTWDITLSFYYCMAHYAAGFSLVVLEGSRSGNRGRIVSRTAIFGMIAQNITYTVTIPLYLALHLLTSPVAQPIVADPASVLAVDSGGSGLISLSNLICYFVPAFMMALPSPSVVPAKAHYAWDAVWQAFPLTQGCFHWLLESPRWQMSSAPHASKAHLRDAKATYVYILSLCVATQVGLFAIALIPAAIVPAAWKPVFAEVDLLSAFVPYLPWNSPMVDPVQVTAEGRAELVRLFFQWDVYTGGTAVFVWALYVFTVAQSSVTLTSLAPKVVKWTMLGGPTAAAAVLLWERDEILDDQEADQSKVQ